MSDKASGKKAMLTGDIHRQKGALKTARIPIKIQPVEKLPKPHWIRVKASSYSSHFHQVKNLLKEQELVTVCDEASCPNRGECYGNGTAAFMVMGDRCTRRCPFCDVAHGRPDPLDEREPERLAKTISALGLSYVVVTSVNRDDLRDGGASHFVECIRAIRGHSPDTRVEILTPDFRNKMNKALDALSQCPPDIFNHNLETVPRLYLQARPGADYSMSLNLLKAFGERCPDVPTKSGLMVGLGETDEEIIHVMEDLRRHGVSMLTIGQYLMPSSSHLPVLRYVELPTFEKWRQLAAKMGFVHAAIGPMVRSSYHADLQAKGVEVK